MYYLYISAPVSTWSVLIRPDWSSFSAGVIEKNGPGLHYHLPKPAGNALLVDTASIIQLESGFRTDMNYRGKEPEMYLWENMHNEGRYTKVPEEALTIAGDENLIDVNFICYYKITDPVQYALNIENAHETLRNLFVYEIHSLCAQYSLDDLLSSKRGEHTGIAALTDESHGKRPYNGG